MLSYSGNFAVVRHRYDDTVYWSTDLGATWTASASSVNFTRYAMSKTGDRMVATNGSGAFVSLDYAVSWQFVGSSRLSDVTAIACNESCSQIVFGEGGGSGLLFISEDFGES
eukprot:gene21199-26922_t